ncbi:MAG: hypothetical protein ABSG93_19650 [Solirubrobacteraceae bacterium]
MRMHHTRPRPRGAGPAPAPVAGALLAGAALLALCGCGSSGAPSASIARQASVPKYVTEPFTHEQQLVEQGAHLVIADGCSACHLMQSARSGGPSFLRFAGYRVTLTDGRSLVVDERFLQEGLLDPRANELQGFDAAPMLAALARLHLREHPAQVAALTAFIEQVGPEPAPE